MVIFHNIFFVVFFTVFMLKYINVYVINVFTVTFGPLFLKLIIYLLQKNISN